MKKILAATMLFSILSFSANASAQHTASLAWTPSVTADITSQQVLRGSAAGGPYTTIVPALGSGLVAYIDAMVQPGQTYYYVLTATDPNGVSGFSNEATAVIPGAPPPPPPPSGVPVFLRYGTSASYTDASGNVWKSGACPGSTASVTHVITKTTTQPLYQFECYGSSWTLKVTGLTPNAPYTLTGKFAETYWTAAGKRVFSVTANGAAWLSGFDIFKDAGGAFIADDKSTSVTADASGAVMLAFTTSADNAKIDALSLAPSGPPPPPVNLSIACTFPVCTINESNIPSGTSGTVNVTIGGATASAPVVIP